MRPRVGLPDEHSGEAVKLFVVKQGPGPHRSGRKGALRRRGSPTTSGRNSSSSATELPKSNVGKILRRKLRDRITVTADRRQFPA
jgi:long-chain acyl-CoA synthetase